MAPPAGAKNSSRAGRVVDGSLHRDVRTSRPVPVHGRGIARGAARSAGGLRIGPWRRRLALVSRVRTSLGIVMVEPNPQIDLTVDGMTIDEIPEGSSID
jgi:hypothetical protein